MEIINVIVLQLITACAQGSYLIELRIESYTNPSSKCAECSQTEPFQRDFGCCDAFEVVSGPCRGDDRCDNYFRYCLRVLGTSNQTIGCPGNSILSELPDDNDFNSDTQFSRSEVLGLPNPLTLVGQETQWQGTQIYIEPIDYDLGGDDETIDIITMDIPSSVVPGSPESGAIQLTGAFGFATVTIRYMVLCPQFFYSNFCENFNNCLSQNVMCKNGGMCRDLDDDYKCECVPGYLGRHCEDIDYCFDTSCSNRGQCQALSDSFICRCDTGYTGQECELDIDDCVGVTCSGNGQCISGIGTFTCLCDQGFTGNLCATRLKDMGTANTPKIAGGIAGGGVLTVLLVVVVACVLVVWAVKRKHNKKTKEVPLNLQHNPAYGHINPVHRAHNRESSVRSCTSAAITDATSNRPSSIQGQELEPDLDGSDDHIYEDPEVPQPSYYVNVSV